jgi:hypothetical protein
MKVVLLKIPGNLGRLSRNSWNVQLRGKDYQKRHIRLWKYKIHIG